VLKLAALVHRVRLVCRGAFEDRVEYLTGVLLASPVWLRPASWLQKDSSACISFNDLRRVGSPLCKEEQCGDSRS
jgi:hypothetical protein